MPIKVYLYHIRINKGGYDSYGRYWGTGPRLYRWLFDTEELGKIVTHSGYLRAFDREVAKYRVRNIVKNITFSDDNEARFFDDRRKS